MIGNVWEWCRDRYAYYDRAEARDGDGLRMVDGDEIRVVIRGGGFTNRIEIARSGLRVPQDPLGPPNSSWGLRPVRELDRQP